MTATSARTERARPRYERPVIVRHAMGMMNKFSRVQALQPLTHIDGVAVERLVDAYGSPLFVFSERTLVSRYRELRDAFALRFPRLRLAWSYKTNYLGAICRVLHREGAWAEVVSGLEYDKAVGLGVPAERIHFNGPFKPEPVLERALTEGAMVHIDHFDELRLAERIAERAGIRPGVALRVSVTVAGVPAWHRFGFHLESGQARDAARRLLAGGRLELAGLHCHLGTFIQETQAYREAAAKIAGFANALREDHGVMLRFIDLGGGFASHNDLKGRYLPGEQATPPFARYAEAIADGLSALDDPPDRTPALVLETGRALVDEAGYAIATVQASKRLPDGRRGLVLDAGTNVLFTSYWYNHDVVPAQSFSRTLEPTVLFGPLCMSIDVVRDTMLFPPLGAGDRVVLRNVGAYNVTQWMQFITGRPAVVLIGRDGRHALVREAEGLEALTRYERMPEWLEGGA